MKLFTTFLIAAAALSAAPITTQVKLVNAGSPSDIVNRVTIDGDTKYNVYIGPYTLSLNGQNTAGMCIDFFDGSNVGNTWNAYVTQVGSSNLSNTYHPTYGQEYEKKHTSSAKSPSPARTARDCKRQPGILQLTASPILRTSI